MIMTIISTYNDYSVI